MDWYWISTWRWTVAVAVRGGVIREAPPIVRRFGGSPLAELVGYALRLDRNTRIEAL